MIDSLPKPLPPLLLPPPKMVATLPIGEPATLPRPDIVEDERGEPDNAPATIPMIAPAVAEVLATHPVHVRLVSGPATVISRVVSNHLLCRLCPRDVCNHGDGPGGHCLIIANRLVPLGCCDGYVWGSTTD